MTGVQFHGTREEAEALTTAIGRNCTCVFDEMGQTTTRCAPHRALVEEQRFVDGLLYARRMAECLKREENSV